MMLGFIKEKIEDFFAWFDNQNFFTKFFVIILLLVGSFVVLYKIVAPLIGSTAREIVQNITGIDPIKEPVKFTIATVIFYIVGVGGLGVLLTFLAYIILASRQE